MTKGHTYVVSVVDRKDNRHSETLVFATSPRAAVKQLQRQDAHFARLASRGARFNVDKYAEAGFIVTQFAAMVVLFLALLAVLTLAGILAMQAVR